MRRRRPAAIPQRRGRAQAGPRQAGEGGLAGGESFPPSYRSGPSGARISGEGSGDTMPGHPDRIGQAGPSGRRPQQATGEAGTREDWTMAKGTLIAAMNIGQAAPDEFHDWYDTEHLPERQ